MDKHRFTADEMVEITRAFILMRDKSLASRTVESCQEMLEAAYLLLHFLSGDFERAAGPEVVAKLLASFHEGAVNA